MEMAHDEHSASGAAPVRARSNEPGETPSETPRPPAFEPSGSRGAKFGSTPSALPNPQDYSYTPPPPRFHPPVAEDLRVPWGWVDVLLFVVLGIVGAAVVTWGAGQLAVRVFGVKPSDMFGTTITTPKSIVVLMSQAALDVCAILILYLLVMTRTAEPFWHAIGWREARPGSPSLRESAVHFLAGGAALALVVSFAGGFLNSKETLPIEQLLKARSSVILFGVLGVLVAPLVEETIFRGFLYPVIARWLGVAAGVVVTGTLFGLMHAAQLWGGWGQIALLIMVGIVLTWVRARTGTVAASYFVHLGYNGLQLVGYLVYLIGGHHQ